MFVEVVDTVDDFLLTLDDDMMVFADNDCWICDIELDMLGEDGAIVAHCGANASSSYAVEVTAEMLLC